jgi:abnormal spindle-like microcephaly-associated protein
MARRVVHEARCYHEAVITIQRTWKSYTSRMQQKNEAAVQVQRIWRGFWAQLQFQIDIMDIVTVQSCVRKIFAVKRKQWQLQAVSMLQRTLRVSLAKNRLKEARLTAKDYLAAIVIQVSNMCIHKQFTQFTFSTLSICQKHIRTFHARKLMASLKIAEQASTQIQTAWRCKHTHGLFKKTIGSIVRLQALYRTTQSVRRFSRTRSGTVKIQSVYRMYYAIKSYHTARNIVIFCQSKCRRLLAMQHMRVSINAAVQLQKVIRVLIARLSRRSLEKERDLKCNAATCIQQYWRGYITSASFKLTLQRIVLLQSLARRVNAQVITAKRYNSVIQLQSFGRIVLAKQMAQERLNYLMLRERSALRIQSTYRGYFVRVYLRSLHYNACSIQYAYWKHVAREQKKYAGATVIQRNIRGTLAKKEFLHKKACVRIIQCAFRRYAKQNALEQKSACKIQNSFRRFIVRRELCILHSCATSIQKNYRMHACLSVYQETQINITVVQSVIRRWIAQRSTLRLLIAIIKMQCYLRAFFAKKQRNHLELQRRMNWVAVTIQRLHRGINARCYFQQMQRETASAVTLQRVLRGYVDRQAFARLMINRTQQLAVTVIQRIARGVAGRIKAAGYREVRLRTNAAMSIQSSFRGYLGRGCAAKVKREMTERLSAIVCQSLVRGFIMRKSYRTMLQHWRSTCSAIVIQRIMRGRWDRRKASIRRQVILERKSAVLVQSTFRGFVTRRDLARQYEIWLQEYCALAIQRSFRGHVARLQAKRERAARRIQKTWRCFTIHVEYLLAMLSLIIVQKHVRSFLCRRNYERQISSVVTIQKYSRMMIWRRYLSRAQRAATCVQAIVRMALARRHVKASIIAIVTVQSIARGWLVRLNVEIEHFAATEIQKTWRVYYHQTIFAWCMLSTIKIQSVIRRHLAHLKTHEIRMSVLADQLLVFRCAIKIQQRYRYYTYMKTLHAAALVLQSALRQYASTIKFARLRQAFIKLQAMERGKAVRRRRQRALLVHARRIELANKKAKADPRLLLGYRTSAALSVLQTSKSLSEIMAAVCTLEIATRYSKVCCVAFAHAGAPNILFSLIRTCNRSLPHVELLYMVLLTMSNVAHHPESLPSLATSTGVEVFLDLVQMFRDKDNIFCSAISLLDQVLQFNRSFQVSLLWKLMWT